jgi:uncharacterized protein (TIRG00374 family)
VRSYRKWTVFTRYLLGFGILAYLFYKIEVGNVLKVIVKVDSQYLVASIFMALFVRILQAWQLSIGIQHHQTPIDIKKTFEINMICQFYGLFLPGVVVGGGVKSYKLYKHIGKWAEVFSTIFFIRFINTFFILFVGICAILIENPFGLKRIFWLILVVIGAMGIGYICMFSKRFTNGLETYVTRLPVWIPGWLTEGLRKFLMCLLHFKYLTGKQIIKLFIAPIGSMVFSILMFFFVAKSIHQWIPIISLMWIISVVYIIHFIPVSISGLGLREGALVLLLPNYGIDESSALAFSLITFVIVLLFGLVGGAIEAKEVFFNTDKRQIGSREKEDLSW